jgi:hypothetical protein
VNCIECLASTNILVPQGQTEAEAIAAWNTRAAVTLHDGGEGLERAKWLVNAVEGNVRAALPAQADQLLEVWRLLASLTPPGSKPASDDGRGALVEAKKIETVAGDFYNEPGEPFWRVEIDSYCADFDFELAARNFADAINRRLSALSTPANAEVVEVLRAARPYVLQIVELGDLPELAELDPELDEARERHRNVLSRIDHILGDET